MLLIDALAEDHIQSALRRGEFDDLPGGGRPLSLDDDSAVPEALRAGYRILHNAGYLPPEGEMRKEILALDSLLNCVESAAEAAPIRRRLGWLNTRLALQGREINLLLRETAYREKLLRKMSRDVAAA